MNVKVDDLVLKVSHDHKAGTETPPYDVTLYDDFLDYLCEHRYYNKEAAREVTRFFLSGAYASTEQLARENFAQSPALQEFYGSADMLVRRLHFRDRLACSVDQATGTGKSFVMYAIAQIMLCEGAVDQVLILCPSTTIERGLTDKFRQLAADSNLRATLPPRNGIVNPRIVNSSVTIQKGDICIENIHATYERTGSSIDYSLNGRGRRTLVLNDEAHHIYNRSGDVALNQWGEFLASPYFGFRYIVGLSGTPYVGNDYFPDVVYRYSLMQAMQEGFIKVIDYVQKDETKNWDERMQVIYQNHRANQKTYSKVKPLTILVTQTISGAERLAEDIRAFLRKREGISREQVEAKVIVVTSSDRHKANVAMLDKVDDPNNPVEWITSVSMLTEGWDVKNVFQIVPHEERAFNSKLLVAQVLGRGLRVPPVYANGAEPPIVTVFNHDAWSSKVKGIVEEVIGIETRLRSYLVDKPQDYHFELHNLSYTQKDTPRVLRQRPEPYASFPQKINLSSQGEVIARQVEYVTATSGATTTQVVQVEREAWTVREVARDVYNKLVCYDPSFAQQISLRQIVGVIESSLADIGDDSGKLAKENKKRVEDAYNVMQRRAVGTNVPQREADKLELVSTRDIRETSVGLGELRHTKSFIYEGESVNLSKPEDVKQIEEIFQELPRRRVIEVKSPDLFKCPLNVVILSHNNEHDFARRLVDAANAPHVTAWVKSPDSGFYSIPYTYQAGTHSKEGAFNPDFFLLVGDDVLPVEIKADDDMTEINRAKLRYARRHFNDINQRLEQEGATRRYYFKFLSPNDFTNFFHALSQGKHREYRSELETELG